MIITTMTKRLHAAECTPSLLKDFDRLQRVDGCWRKENGEWVVKNIAFTEQWDENDKRAEAKALAKTAESGGAVLAVYLADGSFAAFASIETELFGQNKEYASLSNLHVSNGCRGQGIGKALFKVACGQAKALGAKKLYISAHSAKETQAFYRGLGCKDAEEVNPVLYEKEPCDCHLEFLLA